MKAALLKINLSNRSCKVEAIPGKVIRQYLGGRGLGSYLLYRSVPAKADPLGEENHLIFTAGPASGTNLYYSSKSIVTTKSPLTNIYLYSVSSGTFPHQMKKAGFCAIDIEGIADSPVYIAINNKGVEIKDATHLWGMKTDETQRVMLGGLSPNKAATIAIGPAGEKLLKYAAILAEGTHYRTFGRGGAGCVMGSKKLKGVVISGDGKVEAADRDRFEAVKRTIVEKVKAIKELAAMWRRYGTGGDFERMNALGILPARNWQGGQFEGWPGISFVTTEEKWPKQNRVCGPFCPTPCAHYIEIKSGPYKGAHCDGPEYETLYALGTNCGISKLDAIVAADQICDEYGIDTITAGVTIGFAMECFERGLIGPKDTDGIELRFGDDQAMIAMLSKIVNQEGFGRRLGEGVKRLSQEIKGSEAFAMHIKGLELGGYECRGLMGQALEFAIDNRGGCHHGYGLPGRSEAVDGSRMEIKGKGEQVKSLAIHQMIYDSIPVCAFTIVRSFFDVVTMAEAVSSLFGESWCVDDLKEVGVRIMCQEGLYNMREGLTRKDDSLPARLLNEPKPDGPTKGVVVPLEKLKDDYYRAMGWDLLTGNPPDSLLDELKIEK